MKIRGYELNHLQKVNIFREFLDIANDQESYMPQKRCRRGYRSSVWNINKRKEVNPMKARYILTITIMILLTLLVSQAFGMSGGPVTFRLKWQPGESYKYRINLQNEARTGSESAHLQLTSDMTLRVREPRSVTETLQKSEGVTREEQTISVTGRLMEIGFERGDLTLTMNVSGRNLRINVGKESVSAHLNGNLLPHSQLEDLRRDMKPLQDLMRAPVILSMTDSGRIMKVMGLENMDPASRKELALEFLNTMLLPEKPMKIGDHFKENRSLESLFPKQPGQNQSLLAGQTISLVKTLKSIRPGKNGRMIAEFSTPFKEKFNQVPFGERNRTASMEADMLYTTVYDLEYGTMLQETGKGTIWLRPNGGNAPILMTLRPTATFELIEASGTRVTYDDRR